MFDEHKCHYQAFESCFKVNRNSHSMQAVLGNQARLSYYSMSLVLDYSFAYLASSCRLQCLMNTNVANKPLDLASK